MGGLKVEALGEGVIEVCKANAAAMISFGGSFKVVGDQVERKGRGSYVSCEEEAQEEEECCVGEGP